MRISTKILTKHAKVLFTLFAAFQFMLYPLRADQVGYYVYSGGSASACAGVVTHTHVQDCTGSNSGTTTVTCTFGSNLGASHFMFVCAINSGTDRGNGNWTGDGSAGSIISPSFFYYSSGAKQDYCSYSLSTTGGGKNITLTVGGNFNNVWAYGMEFTNASVGIDQADPPTVFTAPNTNTSTAVTSRSITTTCNGELVIGNGSWDLVASTITANSGFTKGAVSPVTNGAVEYQTQGSLGAIHADFTIDTSAFWRAYVASFK